MAPGVGVQRQSNNQVSDGRQALIGKWCPGCRVRLGRHGPSKAAAGLGLCQRCLSTLWAHRMLGWGDPVEGLAAQGALWPYLQPVPGLIVAAKNGNRRRVLSALGAELGRWIAAETAEAPEASVVTWIPASRRSVRRRGFDQGRVLAGEVGRSLGLPVRRLLVRRPDASRRGADRLRRLQGPELRTPLNCPKGVILVDDVCTTGASLRVGAQALTCAGATSVLGLTLARVQ